MVSVPCTSATPLLHGQQTANKVLIFPVTSATVPPTRFSQTTPWPNNPGVQSPHVGVWITEETSETRRCFLRGHEHTVHATTFCRSRDLISFQMSHFPTKFAKNQSRALRGNSSNGSPLNESSPAWPIMVTHRSP